MVHSWTTGVRISWAQTNRVFLCPSIRRAAVVLKTASITLLRESMEYLSNKVALMETKSGLTIQCKIATSTARRKRARTERRREFPFRWLSTPLTGSSTQCRPREVLSIPKRRPFNTETLFLRSSFKHRSKIERTENCSTVS